MFILPLSFVYGDPFSFFTSLYQQMTVISPCFMDTKWEKGVMWHVIIQKLLDMKYFGRSLSDKAMIRAHDARTIFCTFAFGSGRFPGI